VYVSGKADEDTLDAMSEKASILFLARFGAQGKKVWRKQMAGEFSKDLSAYRYPKPALTSLAADPDGNIHDTVYFRGRLRFQGQGSAIGALRSPL
jgi:hypothetical protein